MMIRRKLLSGVFCLGGASALAAANVGTLDAAVSSLDRLFGPANGVPPVAPYALEPSKLAADFIMDAMNLDSALRAEIAQWLASKYPDEVRAARSGNIGSSALAKL